MRRGAFWLVSLMSGVGVAFSSGRAQSPPDDSPAHSLSVPNRTELRDKACVLAAAQRLPAIPGSVIIANRTRLTKASIIVELDVRAAGVDATFGFTCRIAYGGIPLAVPTGLVR